MAYTQMFAPVLEKKALACNIIQMKILCPEIAKEAKPGQFLHILPTGFTLRRPISICSIDQTNGTLTIVFEIKAEGTNQIANLVPGNTMDVLGPLGHGFTILPNAKKVVVIGGGIGNPPMHSLAETYHEKAIAICGFRSANIVTLQKEFQATGAQVVLCTDDGTMGRKALVTEPLKEILEKEEIDMVYACGPKPMLKFVAAISEEFHVPCEVSLEERMGCGIGACLVCACQLKDHDDQTYMGHVCKNGPVFNSKEVVW